MVEDIQVVVYSEVKKTGLKKKPDVSEIAVSGKTNAEKIHFIKEHLGKEISITDVFPKGMIDIRGVTKGKGFQGTVKRFGVHFRSHKAEKGQRRVGSIGPWHPMGVRFRVPMPGQMGLFSRPVYNSPIVSSKKLAPNSDDEIAKRVFDNFGILKTDYIILAGSVQGPQKRQVLLTAPFRPSKLQLKKSFELIELR